MRVLKIKIMSLFKLGDFLGELRSGEMKKYFPKKHVVYTMYLHLMLLIEGIVKYIEVRIPTMRLSNDLAEQNTDWSVGTGWSKGGRRPSPHSLPRKAFYFLLINIGMHPNSFTIFGSANKKVISVKRIAILLKNTMERLIKIYEPTMALVKRSKSKPEQILGVGIEMQELVEPENGINHSLFNFEEAIVEIFYLLFNKSVAIQLSEAIIIPIPD